MGQETWIVNIWLLLLWPLWVPISSSLKQSIFFPIYFLWLGNHLLTIKSWEDVGCCYYTWGELGKIWAWPGFLLFPPIIDMETVRERMLMEVLICPHNYPLQRTLAWCLWPSSLPGLAMFLCPTLVIPRPLIFRASKELLLKDFTKWVHIVFLPLTG